VGSTLIDIKAAGGSHAHAAGAAAPPADASAHASHGVQVVTPAAAHTPHSRVAGIPEAGKILTTPAVRKIAKERGLDLAKVVGSGPKGRVLKEDVLAFLAGKQQQQQQSPHQQQAATARTSAHTVASSTTSGAADKGDQRVPIRGIQRLMVKSMTESLQVGAYC
jgi:pyruvate/2-oxoglutarate dehydrogenase complex dihydrolipoamide acyltransferase (E2) component